jgi:hypothetical protein
MSYRTVSPMVTSTFPEENLYGVEPGVAHAVSDSHIIIIAPRRQASTRLRLRQDLLTRAELSLGGCGSLSKHRQ